MWSLRTVHPTLQWAIIAMCKQRGAIKKKEKRQKTKVDMAGGGEGRKRNRRRQPTARNKTNTEPLRDVHLTFLSQKKPLSENSSSMRTHELRTGGGRGSQGYVVVSRSWHPAHPSPSLWCLFVLLSLKKKKLKLYSLANQRGGPPPAWDPLNSGSFFPAALESTDLILITRPTLPPSVLRLRPHRFHTSPPLYKWLSIGSPPTDLSTLSRPVLSSVLQAALVTSQSCWALQQRGVLKAKNKRKREDFTSKRHFPGCQWTLWLKGFSHVHSCGEMARRCWPAAV